MPSVQDHPNSIESAEAMSKQLNCVDLLVHDRDSEEENDEFDQDEGEVPDKGDDYTGMRLLDRYRFACDFFIIGDRSNDILVLRQKIRNNVSLTLVTRMHASVNACKSMKQTFRGRIKLFASLISARWAPNLNSQSI